MTRLLHEERDSAIPTAEFLPSEPAVRHTLTSESHEASTHRNPADEALQDQVMSQINATCSRIALLLREATRSCPGMFDPATVLLLESGRFYAARARYEHRGDDVPVRFFRRLGLAFIAEGHIAEGCAAFGAVDARVPRRALIRAGDAFLAESDTAIALAAYEQAAATPKIALLAETLIARGAFFAARAAYERAGLPIPVERFREVAGERRAAGDVIAATGAEAAAGLQPAG